MKKESDIRIKSLAKALDILECFSVDSPELGITEISQMLGLNKSNVHDIISTFEYKGYVRQNPLNGKYRLGMRILTLGSIIRQTRTERDEVNRYLRALAQETGEIAYYGIQYESSILYLDQFTENGSLVIHPVIGTTAPLYCTATGKAILANLPQDEIEEVLAAGLPARTPKTITDPAKLHQELAQIRIQGYSVDNMEHEHGVMGVGLAILNKENYPVAAISVSGPSLRFSEDQIKNFAQLLNQYGRRIQRLLI